MLGRTDPCFLHRILRIGNPPSQRPQQDLVEAGRVQLVELAERLLARLAAELPNQIAVARARGPVLHIAFVSSPASH